MATESTAALKINLKHTTDEELVELFKKTKFELGNEVTTGCYPEQAKTIKGRYQVIKHEMVERNLSSCLDEMNSMYDKEKSKTEFMFQWLDNIDLQNIEKVNTTS